MEQEFDIGAWVKAARLHWKQSQEALGERLGKTKGNISAWEKGRHEPSFKQVLQISAITGWPLPEHIMISVTKDVDTADLIDPDELADVIRGYYKANATERDAILHISRTALARSSKGSGRTAS